MYTEGWLNYFVGVTMENQADATQKAGKSRAKSHVNQATMEMNDRSMAGNNQFLKELMKDFASMTENTSSFGDPMQAVAEVLASVTY